MGMSPDRAIFPITPEPGFTSSRFSSNTTVPPVEDTVGPLFMAVPPGLIIEIPLLPDSDDPMASVMTRLGNWREERVFDRGGEECRGRGDADQRRQVVGHARLARAPR